MGHFYPQLAGIASNESDLMLMFAENICKLNNT